MNMTLQLPNNYLEIEEEEMMYLDGGFSLPNWAVAGGINMGVNFAASLIMGGGGGIALAKAAIRAVGTRTFTNTLRDTLKKFIAIRAANAVAGTLVVFITGSGGWSIGSAAANWFDSRDKNRNNTWCDF
ncbi:MAG: hypothetical protein RR481_08600 [Longicatena sp.]